MLIHDDIFSWEGFGGKLRLGSGKCRLRIFDLSKKGKKGLSHLRPIIVVVSDIPESRMSVRSCAGHIATSVAHDFHIDPHRMVFVEYYPSVTYGQKNDHHIAERYDAVEFVWHDDKAMHPKWRALKPPLLDVVKKQLKAVL
jgi:hypothetical protein